MISKYVFMPKTAQNPPGETEGNLGEETPAVPQTPPVDTVTPSVEQMESPGYVPEVSSALTTTFAEWKKYNKTIGYFLNIKGALQDSPLGENLVRLGYKYNRRFGTFGKMVDSFNVEQIEAELMGVAKEHNYTLDTKGIIEAKQFFGAIKPDIPEEAEDKDAISQIMGANIDSKEKVNLTKDMVVKFIQDLAKATDEASSQEVIRNFLDFSARFHKYSLMNQTLIWLQRKDATSVAGGKAWERKFGRKLRDYEVDEDGNVKTDENGQPIPVRPIEIFAPQTKPIKGFILADVLNVLSEYVRLVGARTDLLNLGVPKNLTALYDFAEKRVKHINNFKYMKNVLYRNGGSIESSQKYLRERLDKIDNKMGWVGDNVIIPGAFTVVNVYDYSQTVPDPNFKGKPFEPVSRDVWQSEHNVEDKDIFDLTQAAITFADSKGIKVDLEVETGRAGGWTTGSKIAISKMSRGLRQFATTVHEIAHSLLHFGDQADWKDRKTGEIEAESTVYVVLRSFGFSEPAFCANYLALHRASKEDIIKSMEAVNKSAAQIIDGINKNIVKSAQSYKWYKRAKLDSFIRRIVNDEIFGGI